MSQFKCVLVTGGAGFIGSHVVDALLERGERVTILDNLSPKVHPGGRVPAYVARDARLVVGDVTRREDWLTALEGCEAVVHLAAYQDYNLDFSTFFAVNSVSTALLFELLVAEHKAVARVVVASSQAVYGEGRYRCKEHGSVAPGARALERLEAGLWECTCPICGAEVAPEPAREDQAGPTNTYGLSKLDQEKIALVLGRTHGIATSALRFSIVQGRRQSPHNLYSGALRSFVLQALAGKPLYVFEDGQQLRDYVHIADAVAATLVALRHPKAVYRCFNVGGGEGKTVRSLAEAVSARIPGGAGIEVPSYYRVGDTRHIVSDTSALQSLGWQAHGKLSESVAEYLEWVRPHLGSVLGFEDTLGRMLRDGVVRKAAVSR